MYQVFCCRCRLAMRQNSCSGQKLAVVSQLHPMSVLAVSSAARYVEKPLRFKSVTAVLHDMFTVGFSSLHISLVYVVVVCVSSFSA